MIRKSLRLALFMALAACLFAQKPGGGNSGGVGHSNTAPPPLTRPANSNPSQQQVVPPSFISGKVTLDDGQPAPNDVILRRVCGNRSRDLGYTDGRGEFSVNLVKPEEPVVDVGDDGFTTGNTRATSSRVGLLGCDLQAVLPGFRADPVNLSNLRQMERMDVGTIILHRLGNVEGTTISVTSALAPADARRAYEKGLAAAQKQKWENARKELSKAVSIYPKYAVAWAELGRVQEQTDSAVLAKQSYESALTADSKLVTPYLRLAVLAYKERQWQSTADYSKQVIQLNPVDFSYAYLLNSIANYQLRNFSASEQSATQGQKVDRQHSYPKFDHLLGLCLAMRRDYAASVEHLNAFLEAAPNGPEAPAVRKLLGEVQALATARQ